jgi:iron complex outermembrane recepter protein
MRRPQKSRLLRPVAKPMFRKRAAEATPGNLALRAKKRRPSTKTRDFLGTPRHFFQWTRWCAAAIGGAFALGLVGTARADNFDIPPGHLGEVAATLGVQAGVTITVTEPDVADEYSPGVSGDLSLHDALDRALRGTGAEAVFYDRTTIRIVRKRAPPPSKEPGKVPAPPATEQLEEIVVAASKQNMPLDTYPGSVKVIKLDPGWTTDNAAGGTGAITQLLPALSSTNLGPGRDKLFIRGLADSSFNGPTQATAGQYLGDVRLNYNAPDPDLNLYDMRRVEVLVGPQGTLYGDGSLGGVIRLVPNDPDADEAYATTSAGVSSTESGSVNGDGAAMFNVPLLRNQVALRVVTYGARDAGYIDDIGRDLRDINSTASYGQRWTLRVENLWNWTFDFGAVIQNINDADSQYTLRGYPPLTRSSVIPQPFRNNYRVTYIIARRAIGEAELVSTTSSVWQGLKTVFDATGHDGTMTPARFEEDNDTTLISHETRIAGGSTGAPWVAGLTTLFSRSLLSRTLGPLNAPVQIAGVTNVQANAALFGQISHPFTRTLTGTIGERFTFANSTGALTAASANGSPISTRNSGSFSNTLALDWHPGGPFSGFFHYQQGNRAGGLAVAPSGSGLQSQKFSADELNMDEIGIRFGHEAYDPLLVRMALFVADWNHMQADLVDSAGLPYTTNIGRGRIYGLDTDVTWHPAPPFTLSAAAFLNDSKLVAPEPEFVTAGKQTLPNVARNGGRLAAQWNHETALGGLSAEGSVRYVGKSTLGVGQLLDIPQGNYFVVDAGARLDLGRFTLSLNLANLGNVRANTFAFGNPFGLAQRNQMTPLQPRTLRFGIDSRF